MKKNYIRRELAQGTALITVLITFATPAHTQQAAPVAPPASPIETSPVEASATVADATDQAAPASPDAGAADIVVTGSRISASGFNTPTPVTVASSERLKEAAPGNLADGLNQLPVFAGSLKSSNSPADGRKSQHRSEPAQLARARPHANAGSSRWTANGRK